MSGKSYREIGRFQRKVNAAREIYRRGFDYTYSLYRFKWNMAAKYGTRFAFPLHLDIEVTDACNLRCIMCVHSYKKELKTGFIDISFARDLIDQGAGNGLYSLKFNWRGEPLLHKGLEDLVAYAKLKGIIDVQFNTNGMLLTEERIERLIDAGLDRIIFSLDGATKQTYERIRVGGNFDRVVENIGKVYEKKRERDSVRPFVRVQMVRMKDNKDEVDLFMRTWKPFVDDIRISDVTDRGQGDQLAVGDQVAVGRKRCPQPWQRLVISREGDALMCCGDWFKEQKVGDARTQTIREIWLGPQMREIRRIQREGKLNGISPCKDCFVKESYVWEKRRNGDRKEK
ncbi:MAG: radical SAM protein [Alphaproteobacteria bacterium]|uniref:Radical SAM protein n=1 Tax=Candidatus Nitrobium versatile TaxID=2884831 RepID=A0A953J4S1_9BACT|nr:radical SAM protein [Candidatus Nitrobium versatile]